MSQVIAIEPVQTSAEHDGSINTFEASVDFSHAFQIRTRKDGFNAGRKYFVQTSSDDTMTELIDEISQISKAIAEKLATKSKWGKIQKKVRRIYNSSKFQGAAAFLIIAVKYFCR
jgi:hypothetical protein